MAIYKTYPDPNWRRPTCQNFSSLNQILMLNNKPHLSITQTTFCKMASYRECKHVYPGRPNSDLYISSVQQHLFRPQAFMPDFRAQTWPSGPCMNTMQGPEPACPPQFFCTNSVCPPDAVHSGLGHCENIWNPRVQTKAEFLPQKSNHAKSHTKARAAIVYWKPINGFFLHDLFYKRSRRTSSHILSAFDWFFIAAGEETQ